MARSASASPRREPATAYTAQLDDAFEVAISAAGLVEHGLSVGGQQLLLRFAGPALEQVLLPALDHVLTRPPRAHAGVVRVWDSATTGVPLPDPPWTVADIEPTGRLLAPGLTGVHLPTQGRLTIRGTAPGDVHWWAASPDVVPWWERGAPLRIVFHWLLTGGGRQLVHAAAMGDGRRGVLIPGASGSGKSTLALACLEAGMGYAGDDYVLLDVSGRAVAHNIYATARVDVHTLALFPALAAARFHMDGEKTVLALNGALRAQIRQWVPIDAVVIPHRTQTRDPRAVPVTAGEGLLALAPSSVLQLPDRGGGALSAGAELLRRVPAYRLELGSDPRAAVGAIRSVLEEAERR